MGIRKCSPIDKKVVLYKQSSKRSNSRKTKTFLVKGLEKINQGSEYPGFSRWLCSSFSKETFSIKDSFPIGNKPRTTKTYGQGIEGNVKEAGAISQTSSRVKKGRVLKKFVLCKKEQWGEKASNKSETSKCVYTIQSLQNGRTAKSEIFVTGGRLYVQARSKGCILLRSFTENLEEIRSVPLVRKLILISVPMVWLGSCPTNFHKIIKNPNWNFASHKYKNDNLLGRHASNGPLHRGDKHVPQHSNLLVTISGFCNQLEKVCFDTSAGDRIFEAKNQLSQPRNISHRRENTESKNKTEPEPETSILELTRVIGLLTSTVQAVLPARLQCRYLQLQQISSLKESLSNQQKIVLDHQSKIELL